MEQFFADVLFERSQQDRQWGGAAHDDTHTANDWIALIAKHAGKGIDTPPLEFRRQMVRVAALAMAAHDATTRIPQQILLSEDDAQENTLWQTLSKFRVAFLILGSGDVRYVVRGKDADEGVHCLRRDGFLLSVDTVADLLNELRYENATITTIGPALTARRSKLPLSIFDRITNDDSTQTVRAMIFGALESRYPVTMEAHA